MSSFEGGPSKATSVEYGREPCPDRILDDIGGAFGMGSVGGSLWYFVQGIRKSPSGQKLRGGFEAVRGNAPRIGGSFAIWGCLFSTVDCTLVFLRKKEDPWNSIVAGGMTAGILSLRSGLISASRSAMFGAVILSMIEGMQIMIGKMATPPPPRVAMMQGNMPPMDGAGMPPPPPYGVGGAIAPGAMATAQSQPEIMPPSFEVEKSSQNVEQERGGGGGGWWFGFGKKSNEQGETS